MGIALGIAPVHAESPSEAKKMNVLFVAIDDLNDWIGCMGGNPQTKTPILISSTLKVGW